MATQAQSPGLFSSFDEVNNIGASTVPIALSVPPEETLILDCFA